MMELFRKSSLTFSKRQILDSSKLKEFADDNLKFYEKCRKFSERVENIVGKGEIAHHEQQCFQKTCTANKQKAGLVGKGLILFSYGLDKIVTNIRPHILRNSDSSKIRSQCSEQSDLK